MSEERNRVLEGMQEWKEKEQQIADLFSPQALQSRYFDKMKLDHYRELRRNLKDPTKEEKMMRRILTGEISRLEKRLYPSRLIRYAVKLGRFLNNAIRQSAAQPQDWKPELHNFIKNDKKQNDSARLRIQQKTAVRPKLHQKKTASQKKGREKEPPTNESKQLLNTKSVPMIEKNYDYLSNQLKLTGFGEELKDQLKELMQTNEPQFTMSLTKNYGNDETAVTLQFRKSDDSEMYFFNRYNMMLKNQQHPDAIKQTFYINPEGGNITMKEAYNLMCGRAVNKDLTTSKGEEYNAWVQLDFKETDKHGNYITKQFHQNYGYDLNAVLAKHPIKELASETDKTRLVESLQRGNRQSVTLDIKGSDVKVFIEASPQFKSLNFFEASGQRIRTDKLYEGKFQGQSEKTDRKQSHKQGKGGDDDGEPGGQSNKKNNRKRQSIS